MKLPRAKSIISPPLYYLAALAALMSFVLPLHGFGLPGCGFQVAVGRPCFGCGMTRAVTAMSHLEFHQAWHYHPFSFVLWPLMMILALAALWPGFGRFLRRGVLERFDRVITPLFWVGVLLFFAYGGWRMVAEPDWPN